MKSAKLISLLNEIKTLADLSLKELGSTDSGRRVTASDKKNDPPISPDTLPTWILKLRTESFFGKPRTPKEVHEKLQQHYPCDLKRVGVAVLRLQKQRELRKTSKVVDDKRRVAYVW